MKSITGFQSKTKNLPNQLLGFMSIIKRQRNREHRGKFIRYGEGNLLETVGEIKLFSGTVCYECLQ